MMADILIKEKKPRQGQCVRVEKCLLGMLTILAINNLKFKLKCYFLIYKIKLSLLSPSLSTMNILIMKLTQFTVRKNLKFLGNLSKLYFLNKT